MPDYEDLFKKMGVVFQNPNAGAPTLNAFVRVREGVGQLAQNAIVGTPLYEAGIEKEDKILSINGTALSTFQGRSVDELIADKKPGDVIEVEIDRWGTKMTKKVTIAETQNMRSSWDANANAAAQKRREEWLKAK